MVLGIGKPLTDASCWSVRAHFGVGHCYLHRLRPLFTRLDACVSPVMNGLRDLGVLNKSRGIPSAYMQAHEDTRLAVISDLIDIDGNYVKPHNTYLFIPMIKKAQEDRV